MSLVLVTGAPGWLGSRLVDALLHGLAGDTRFPADEQMRVRCLVQPGVDAAALRGPRVELVEGDLRDVAAIRRFVAGAEGSTLFHAAGVIHPRRVREFFDVNEQGTRNLLEAAGAAKVRRFVHVSSNSPFGFNASPDGLFDESSPYHPYLGYGESKRRAEESVLGAGGALEPVVIRAPWFYGPGQPPRQTLFFEMIRDGRAPLVGSGRQRRSMSYVDNLVQGLLLGATVPAAAGRAWWIADERPYAFSEILDTVERVLERDFGARCSHKRMRLPAVASSVADLVDRGLQAAGLYHQKFHVLSEIGRTIACDVGAAQRELGYAPAVALEEGMRRSIASLVERGWRP